MGDRMVLVEKRVPEDEWFLPITPGLLSMIGAVSAREDVATREIVLMMQMPVAEVFRAARKDRR